MQITTERKKQNNQVKSIWTSYINLLKMVLALLKVEQYQKGNQYVVGEKGAELFVPNQTGQITQSARGTSGGSAMLILILIL